MPASTVNWRLHEMVQKGLLQRTGRGTYRLPGKAEFEPEVSGLLSAVAAFVKKQLPLASFCLWDTEIVRSLAHHVPARAFVVFEIEKIALETAFDKLRDRYNHVFLPKDYEIAFNYSKPGDAVIFIKPLLTEAPLRSIKDVHFPELEKILVDVYCDRDLFGFLEGAEWMNIWENALSRYAINTTRLLRYAARRGQGEYFQRLLHPKTVRK